MRALLGVFGILVIGLVVAAFWLRRAPEAEIRAALAVAEAMSGDTTGYARARTIRPLVFPDDYGPHPAFKTEWWYYTGNLETDAGRHFGYEFTIFRFALAPPDTTPEARPSAWAADQLYMAHVALTDAGAEEFYAAERFSRGAAGLAGAQAAPYRVWLEDWAVEATGDSAFPARLRARHDDFRLDLTLTPAKPLVLQGEQGLDPKGPEPGNASYYYSFTRLATEGTVQAGGETFAVRGLSWKDHEWSTSALSPDLEGWDWFALQLDDGTEVMFYQLRRRDGTASDFTNGVFVRPDGTTRPLARADAEIEVLDRWESPRGGTYPARWRLRIPSVALDLDVTPYLADQELDVSVRYWEGAVRIAGTAGGTPIGGNGYVELTGYAEAAGAGEARPRGPGL